MKDRAMDDIRTKWNLERNKISRITDSLLSSSFIAAENLCCHIMLHLTIFVPAGSEVANTAGTSQ
jgi:hypothetical protein